MNMQMSKLWSKIRHKYHQSATDSSMVIRLWGTDIGSLSWHSRKQIGIFQYAQEFLKSGIQLSPIRMPLRDAPYYFKGLPWKDFQGLPGLVSDGIPSENENSVINRHIARSKTPYSPVDRLGLLQESLTGALEFKPFRALQTDIDIDTLVGLANELLSESLNIIEPRSTDDIAEFVASNTSGARAKRFLGWNPEADRFSWGFYNELNYQPWLIKFDGIGNDVPDKKYAIPTGYGIRELAYYKMAIAAGIKMMPCQLHHEGGRSHFMTKRFDLIPKVDGSYDKVHMQSLSAIEHIGIEESSKFSYEMLFNTMQTMCLDSDDFEQQFRRMVFNVLSRNQDDHVKNISFLMNRDGNWSLSPAYDITYSFNPNGKWTSRHQMTINKKRENFMMSDLIALAKPANIVEEHAREIIDDVRGALIRWMEYATLSGMDLDKAYKISKNHILNLP